MPSTQATPSKKTDHGHTISQAQESNENVSTGWNSMANGLEPAGSAQTPKTSNNSEDQNASESAQGPSCSGEDAFHHVNMNTAGELLEGIIAAREREKEDSIMPKDGIWDDRSRWSYQAIHKTKEGDEQDKTDDTAGRRDIQDLTKLGYLNDGGVNTGAGRKT